MDNTNSFCQDEELSNQDKDILRAFSLFVNEHMTSRTFAKLPGAFPKHEVPTLDQARARVAFLSGFKPEFYDCCVNSCCCFVGPHLLLIQCPYCGESRYDSDNNSRKRFSYLPIIPRLQALHAHQPTAIKMSYRAQDHKHHPNLMNDVFDGTIYRSMLGERVVIDGKPQNHSYFGDSRDVALGLSTDGFAPFRRRKLTAWPLILYNYNLPPEIRFLADNILPLGVIPGPKKPVDFDSFLWPAVQELLKLAAGVRAWDSLTLAHFILRAYLIIVAGDIPAISMVMRMKGHNGYAPCRMCNIHGVRIPGKPRSPYYVPLDRSRHPEIPNGDPLSYDPSDLPIRTHTAILAEAREVQLAASEKDSDELAKKYGIKGIPLLSYLPSLNFPLSFPYDFMHLVWENLMKNLVLLWTGEFKGLDEGSESYHLAPNVWKAIGEATAKSGSTIPSCFGRRTPNIEADCTTYNAEAWSFWALYVGPVLLARKFVRPKYYDHFVSLVRILHLCLDFEITRQDILTIRTGLVDWVREFEK